MSEPVQRDAFDRLMGTIDGLPDHTKSRPSTITSVTPLLGVTQTYVVQTFQAGEEGFYLFLQVLGAEGGTRIAIPPKVAAAIYRQRESLIKQGRRRRGRENWEGLTEAQRERRVAHLPRGRGRAKTG